ncbi:MAG: aminodeoxychorismate synthase component I [Candidatus Marinimicrobia bacterium]|nr:aminodeoxychorismate synthase component I [Candidatus Neomarinimicrobiota bacterium]MBL7022975.1 aminodeoxychorismate synthase component I [Candidatus Neomarinimicrobiota bacterium]MBL7108793.1 aminodeoxychorismate synthase component I [Candidatus Neomarinimicrobiota bacterium]
MSEIQSFIKQFGNPDALIDHWEETSDCFAIWGFDETIEFSAKSCLINGKQIDGNPLEILQNTLNQWKSESETLSATGYFSYDFKDFLFKHRDFKKYNSNIPLFWFGKPSKIVKYKIEELTPQKDLNVSITQIQDIPKLSVYQEDIRKIKNYLQAGDIYQINYTHPKKFQINGNHFELYLKFRQSAKPHFGYYLNLKTFQIISLSPERFVRKQDKTIDTFPIKGTRPRSSIPAEDEQLANELVNSEKDRAEHLMIVDLLRNDIGKICKFGAVKVDKLYNIESFETVHHLVTRVYGELKENVSETDIFDAMFPGGSITGAPKERAMEIIDELENTNRGIYTGAIGFIKPNGDLDFNIAIRTMTIENGNGTYGVGGGIVWDSAPRNEWEEAQQKGAILDTVIKETII